MTNHETSFIGFFRISCKGRHLLENNKVPQLSYSLSPKNPLSAFSVSDFRLIKVAWQDVEITVEHPRSQLVPQGLREN